MSGHDMKSEKDIITSNLEITSSDDLKIENKIEPSETLTPSSSSIDTQEPPVVVKKGKKRGRKPRKQTLLNTDESLVQSETDTSTASSKRHSSRLLRKSRSSTDVSLKDSPVILEASNNTHSIAHGTVQNGGNKEFIEPEPAEPKPSYTGLPLEACPTTKIKKEFLWPTRGPGKRGRYSNKEKELFESLKPTEEETEFDEQYRKGLKTNISETLSNNSNIRKPLRAKQTNKSIINELITTPKQTTDKNSEEIGSPMWASKRIKVISPKKNSSTALVPSTASDKKSNDRVDDSTIDNDDFCSTCGGPGIFICCESCPKSFHFTCCDPPLEEVPEDNWHCKECSYKFNKTKPQWNSVGIFGQLLNQMEARNPQVFQLPVSLRENIFIGVTTGDGGDYSDLSIKSEMTHSQVNGSQISGYNWNQDLEVDTLYHKNGKPYLCHYCGLSGQNHKTLVHCDYCPLVWHVDCLKEPLCSPKTLGTKWRCPNHVESLLPSGFNHRQFKNSSVIDVSLHNQFLKIAYMNNILVKYNDQPFLKDSKHPSLQDYLQYQSQDFKAFNEDYIDNPDIEDHNDLTNTNLVVPDYFQNMSLSSGIGSRLPSKLSKIIKLTNSEGETGSCIFRIPEKSIVLDFISKVKDNTSSVKQNVLDFVKEYDNRSRLETNKEERETVDALLEVKTKLPLEDTLDFDKLVSVAMSESKDEAIQESSSKNKLTETEISELLEIKKLIQLKGKDAILEFLQS